MERVGAGEITNSEKPGKTNARDYKVSRVMHMEMSVGVEGGFMERVSEPP